MEDLLNFGPFPNFGPPPPENFKALLIFFHLPGAFHSCFLKSEVYTADASKEAAKSHAERLFAHSGTFFGRGLRRLRRLPTIGISVSSFVRRAQS